MASHGFPRKTGGEVALDLCFPCQGIWFDAYESLQLAPDGVIELFEQIHEHRGDTRLPLADALRCPRCSERLIRSQDRVKSGLFNYQRCGEHGRFITFSQFMIEKGFVRQLSNTEVADLSTRVGAIYCTGCGAPVDIRKDHACPHCRSAFSLIDPDAVEQALNGYRKAEEKRTTRDPDAIAEALIDTERRRSQAERESRAKRSRNPADTDVGDLLLAGVALVLNVLS